MKRYRFGPDVTSDRITAPAKPEPRADVEIGIREVKKTTYPASIIFAPDTYDPATSIPLLTVHFVGIPPGIDKPTDPTSAVEDTRFIVHSADVSGVIDGSPVEIQLPNLVGGVDYLLVSVLEDEVEG